MAVTGSARTSLLLALAASASRADAWCAIAGMPDLGLRGALDAGLDPTRLVLIPDAGSAMPQVLSALVDGVGIVVLGPALALTPSLWRMLTNRARTRDALILAASPPARADLQLEASEPSWSGIGPGSGRLRRRTLEVTAQGRSIAGSRSTPVHLPDVRGLLSATASAGAAVETTGSGALAAVEAPARSGLRVLRRAG